MSKYARVRLYPYAPVHAIHACIVCVGVCVTLVVYKVVMHGVYRFVLVCIGGTGMYQYAWYIPCTWYVRVCMSTHGMYRYTSVIMVRTGMCMYLHVLPSVSVYCRRCKAGLRRVHSCSESNNRMNIAPKCFYNTCTHMCLCCMKLKQHLHWLL